MFIVQLKLICKNAKYYYSTNQKRTKLKEIN
jgi:hypothetical protein